MNYYNDNDPKVCAWLRELIAAGEIAAGVVDCRSILEVKAHELDGYDQCHFFAGIGGWPLALRWAGLEQAYGIWTGSCPCQPLSCAGLHKGHTDKRHLWPAFHDLIAQCKPTAVFGEQVASKDGREWLAGVRLDLEDMGYACGAADLCAAGVGAPHRRQRLFWVGQLENTNGAGRSQQREPIADETKQHAVECAGESCGMADTSSHRAKRNQRSEVNARRARWTEFSCGCANGLLEHTNGARCEIKRRRRKKPERFNAPSSTSRMADSEIAERRSMQTQHSGGRITQVGGSGGWSNFDIISCRDGKARRVEAGTFPLAHGIPGRMGLLRGYGNAIVPQVAEVFVRACMEASEAQRRGMQ